MFDKNLAVFLVLSAALPVGHTMAEEGSGSLLAEHETVIAESIKSAAEDCAKGDKEGTIGYAIKNATKIHLELAAAGPDTRELFSKKEGSCFAGLSELYDLSYAIPSLASIVGAAGDALMAYAEKKVCTAITNVSSIVTNPMNMAIEKVNGLSAFTDLNGLSNGLLQNEMMKIDPELGAEYRTADGESGSININPFNSSQTDFGGGNASASANNLNNDNAQINAINAKLANVQKQVGPAELKLQQARQQLLNCSSYTYNSCATQHANVMLAESQLNSLKSEIEMLKIQLAGVSSRANQAKSVSVPIQQPANNSNSSSGNSIIQSIGNLFN